MSIVTTYVCDVSGKAGLNREDFTDVTILVMQYSVNQHMSSGFSSTSGVTLKKLVHNDVAEKLNLRRGPDVAVEPETTFEGKLKVLLEDHVTELVEGHLENR